MIHLAKDHKIFSQRMADQLLLKAPEKVIVFYRHGLLFAFNFNPTESYTNILVPVHNPGEYNVVLSSDDDQYGGNNLVAHMAYPTKMFDGRHFVELYLPARTAIVLKETVIFPEPEKKEEVVEAPKKKAPAKKTTKKAEGEKAPAKKTTAKKTTKKAEAEVVAEAPAEKPAPKKRTTKKKVEALAEETPAAEAPIEKPAPKKRTTKKKVEAPVEEVPAAEALAEKPAPKKRTTKKKVEAPVEEVPAE